MNISTEKEYNEAFKKIDALIAEDFEGSEAKQKEFLEAAKAIQDYEKKYYPVSKPEHLPGLSKLKSVHLKVHPNQ
ncbi:hypothetical protein [Dyadobacter bucti]|uniref:hypothetical protein n=1 Tax=Dyadobacter bucti TaxID=2572203 RepID=UPI003F6F96FD